MSPALLCAIDRTTSAAVPRIAGGLASSLGAEVLLTSVEDRRLPGSSRSAVASAHATLDHARREIPSDVQVRERVELGSPGAKLLDLAVEEGAELLVTGSRGRGTFRTALFGSVSRELARRSACPVLIVPPQATGPPAGGSADLLLARGIICGVGDPDRSRAVVRVAATWRPGWTNHCCSCTSPMTDHRRRRSSTARTSWSWRAPPARAARSKTS